jgi:hypothetical protein
VVNTKNRGGNTLHKSFTVSTNDTLKSQVRLTVTGKVKSYVTIEPGSVRLFGPVGRSLSGTVKILPLEGHAFTIKEVKAQQNQFIRFQLKPMNDASDNKGYLLLVENTKNVPGSYRDTILITTDSKKKPLLRVPIYARIQNRPTPGGKKPN